MMNVLNMIELTSVAEGFLFLMTIVFLVGITLIGSGLFMLYVDCDKEGATPLIIGATMLMVFIIMWLCSDANVFQLPNGKFQIEATFTDDYPFLSVMEEYNVVEQRGDIFVLEPKERDV